MQTKRFWAVLIALCGSVVSFAQVRADTKGLIPSDLLKADFKVFRDSLEQHHAGLYRYKTKDRLENLFDSVAVELNRSMRLTDFYLLLRFIISDIQDGHTSVNLAPEVGKQLVATVKMFPFQIHFINDRAFIPCKTSPDDLREGTEILSIDKHSIPAIRDKLFAYMPSDGSNKTKKYWDLNNDGFGPLYYLAFGPDSSFEVKVKNRREMKTIMLPGVLREDIKCRPDLHNDSKLLAFNIKNDKVGIITIQTFSSAELKSYNEYADFLETSFGQLKRRGITRLIIDLRNNGGGHDVFGSLLFSYLTDKPFRYYDNLRSTTRVFAEHDHPNLRLQQPAKNNFKGKVYFLINGKSFSTTAEFCSIARSNNRGTFIGEETGGGYYGNTSGASARVVLPNTQIILTIPKTRYTMAVKEAVYTDRGIIPDFIIVPGIDDVIKNRDIQMNYALKLAGG